MQGVEYTIPIQKMDKYLRESVTAIDFVDCEVKVPFVLTILGEVGWLRPKASASVKSFEIVVW